MVAGQAGRRDSIYSRNAQKLATVQKYKLRKYLAPLNEALGIGLMRLILGGLCLLGPVWSYNYGTILRTRARRQPHWKKQRAVRSKKNPSKCHDASSQNGQKNPKAHTQKLPGKKQQRWNETLMTTDKHLQLRARCRLERIVRTHSIMRTVSTQN